MRLKQYLNEVFERDVDLTVERNEWNKWVASFKVANDTYSVIGTRLLYEVMIDSMTPKELKKFTGYDQEDIKKAAEKNKKRRSKIPVPLFNTPRRKIEEFFREYNPVFVISFGSKKFGDKILNIRTPSEVMTIYSGLKKGAEMFIRQVMPTFLIVDAKETKRLKIYERFMKEIIKKSPYKLLGKLRTIDYEVAKTKGWILYNPTKIAKIE